MTDKALLVASLTADDQLDDVARARMWARLEPRLAEPPPRRVRWMLASAVACSLVAAAAVALVLVRRSPDARALIAPEDATLTTHLGPHTRAAVIGPARLRVVGTPGDVTTVHLDRGTLLAEFTGGQGRALHVEAPGMAVDVVGTLFSIEIQAARTCVAVAHGRVEVVIAARRTAVATGQQLCTRDPQPTAIEPRAREALARHGAIVAEAPAPVVVPAPDVAPVPPPAAPPPPVAPPAIASAPPPPVSPPAIANVPPSPRLLQSPSASPPRPLPPPSAPPPRTLSPPSVLHSEPASTTIAPARVATNASDQSTSAQPEPPRDAAPAKPAPPPPPTADELYRAAEAALARHDADAADRALAQLVATSPTSPLVGQAIYERARLAYQRHAWGEARGHLDALAKRGDQALAESGRYLTCRIAVEAHDGTARRCLEEFRADYPASAHDRDVLGTIVQLAFAGGGCSAASAAIADLATRYPHSTLAAAWRAKCPETR